MTSVTYFTEGLLTVLLDEQSNVGDRVSAYRDALLSAPVGEKSSLPLMGFQRNEIVQLEEGGITPDSAWQEVNLVSGYHLLSDEGIISLKEVYALTKRRVLERYPIDPSLASLLNDSSYKYYNGYAQQMAVRLGLTTNYDATLIINLPTGSGKTLVAHALCGFASTNKLTLVIVPTIGLSIEQGSRASVILDKMGIAHGQYLYWYGQQDEQIHNDIKDRIRKGQQRILFCSPESACRSLLPALFYAAESNMLANIVVDEAHLIDQWGAEFRPYFQIFAAVFHSLRKISSSSIKCCLMSATFTDKTLNIISELFSVEGCSPIEIHGSYLRPEIQYSVHQVTQQNYDNEIIKAIRHLPKPLIVYTVRRSDADKIYNNLRRIGFSRIGLFTGNTGAADREILLKNWSLDKIDIMVATSAFGVGMDKNDVRSVLHAAVPENLDRFYQEVGRGGRDGFASQSLLVYHQDQFNDAEGLNNQRLITEKLGLSRWIKMWNTGKTIASGKKAINIRTMHENLQRTSDSNEEWNWRTLLLMQRSGMIEIELQPPQPPEWDQELDAEIYQSQITNYYDQYYKTVIVSPTIGDHLSQSAWESRIGQQRYYEKVSQKQGFSRLKKWIIGSNSTPICRELLEFYTVRRRQPEYVCGGCPGCRKEGRYTIYPHSVGHISHVIGLNVPNKWHKPINSHRLHLPVYYSKKGVTTDNKLIRQWINWITELLENGAITAIRADSSVLEQINKRLPAGLRKFWIGIQLLQDCDNPTYWPELVLLMPDTSSIPDMGLEESPRLIVAPEDVPHSRHYNCAWWERNNEAKSLENFLLGLSYGNN